jgi:TonB family protein
MFEPIEHRRTRHPLTGSFVVHAAIIASIAFHFAPTAVKISSIMKGNHGQSHVTQLASDAEDVSFPVIAKSDESPFSTLKLRAQKKPKKLKEDNNRAEETTTRAGADYGSLSDGPEYGSEVRPALPYIFPDPPVSRDDLPDGVKGKVIVEITIDELGNVIDTKLLQGLHPSIDAKVIATLRTWRFRPATRDGRAIASKQDALFTYPS